MTENEAVHCLKVYTDETVCEECDFYPNCTHETQADMARLAIKALEEIQQYRAIGTVEECREARERQKPKIADIWGDGYADGNLVYDTYECPNCGATYELGCDEYKYCPKCGQAMDLSK